jgi:adenylyltransferase/sulfurtransferase
MNYSRLVNEKYSRIENKTIAIVGIGGTGGPLATLLARSKVKHLILIDFDIVEESNLERQVFYNKSDIGKFKANVLEEQVKPFTKVTIIKEKLTSENIDLLNDYKLDLIIDATDNFETRYAINEYVQ